MKPPKTPNASLWQPPSILYHRTGVEIDIRFGMPRHKCRFHGICSVDIHEIDRQPIGTPAPGKGKGWLFIPRPDYCLICFDKDSLAPATKTLQFQREYFALGEVVPFSRSLARCIGGQACLLPGHYRIMEKQSTYSVLFELLF